MAERLRSFLADPARPGGTLSYHELQGFLFAVVCSPELIKPSEWLPIIFNERDAGYATVEEAQAILADLMAVYNRLNTAVTEETVVLPDDCTVRPRAVDNLDEAAPLAGWSRGFLMGHEWLSDLWDVDLPEDLDQELGLTLMALSFFSSRRLAEGFRAEVSALGPLEDVAESMVQVLPEALVNYAFLGRSVFSAATDAGPPMPARRSVTVGRNDPCPCGSGKKFKKCCGGTSH